MKYLKLLTALIITLAFISVADAQTQQHKAYQQEIKMLQNKIDGLAEIDKVSRATEDDRLVDELESLTRENENLRQENLDLKTQLKSANSFWKGADR